MVSSRLRNSPILLAALFSQIKSRAQQTSFAKQTTSIIKIKVNQSSEAQLFHVTSKNYIIENTHVTYTKLSIFLSQ